jgi:hypothetical protein
VVFGVSAGVARKPVDNSGFVIVNGWVLPAQYFRNEQA